jgi:hypothetical protein
VSENVCLSGGARGADYEWGRNAALAGHKVIHLSFEGHKSKGRPEDTVVLTQAQLEEADQYLVEINDRVLKRTLPWWRYHVISLLRRNYWQVRDTERVYAIAGIDFEDTGQVIGGTAWAVEMFKLLRPTEATDELFVFDSRRGTMGTWYGWNGMAWEPLRPDRIPIPHGRWTGIGARDIDDVGKYEIERVFQFAF